MAVAAQRMAWFAAKVALADMATVNTTGSDPGRGGSGHGRREGRCRTGAMRIRALPVVAELGDGSVFAGGDEDRVVAEALVAAPLRRDGPRQGPGTAALLAVRAERDELKIEAALD